MTDYGHPLLFGALLEPPIHRPADVLRLAELSEQAGLDLVSLADHPYWPHRLDTFTLLAAIAARTEQIRVLANVANLPLRPPTMLARAASTLSVLSRGRFELGIGAGAQSLWSNIVAEGGPRRSAGESVDAVGEALQIIRALWGQTEKLQYVGNHYHLDGVVPGPAPEGDINIWVGAYQARMLRLVGRSADVWITSSPFLAPQHISRCHELIDEAATMNERRPDEVRRAYNIEMECATAGPVFCQGSSKVAAEQIAELTLELGISIYILYRV